MKRVGIICGGSGSSKFASALSDYSTVNEELELGFIANVADNYWHHGLYVCPDVDIITHALAGNLDVSKGWGVDADTFSGRRFYSETSKVEEWFNLGDFDAALCQQRTDLMKNGWSLSAVTEHFCKIFKIRHKIIPSTDDTVATFVMTNAGMMHLQQFWVEHRGIPDCNGLTTVGLEFAEPNPETISYLSKYSIICPANPITSVMPTIQLTGIEKALRRSRVVAISPFIGDKPFSGPAAKLMVANGLESSSLGVAKLYSSFLKLFIVDSQEHANVVTNIKDIGIECVRTNTRIDENSRIPIAREIMSSL